MKRALPEVASLRSESTLVQSDWNVPVFTRQTLGSRVGVAAVPHESWPEVIERVVSRPAP